MLSIEKGRKLAQGMKNDPKYVHPNAVSAKKVKLWSQIIVQRGQKGDLYGLGRGHQRQEPPGYPNQASNHKPIRVDGDRMERR